MKLSQHLFWDTAPESLDFERHARLIIERVVSRGRLTDWKAIVSYYGKDRLRAEAVKIRCLDSKALHFLSWYLAIPLNEFRCFKQQLPGLEYYPY